jgi:tellurite resistance protein
MGLSEVDLGGVDVGLLSSAVESAIAAAGASELTLPSPARLQQGATAVLQSTDPAFATYFQSILEIAYLVASADGFANAEREVLSRLLERVTGRVATSDVLQLHFRDLDDACEMFGRRERLRRAAEDFADTGDRTEVLGFAVLVALADARISEAELAAISEVGRFLGFTDREVGNVVQQVVSSVRAELDRSDRGAR